MPERTSILQKGYSLFSSRKMVTIRANKAENGSCYVRAHVRSSFNNLMTRIAIVRFNNRLATTACCTCTIGRSGMCSHFICVLFQLIHVSQNCEPLLEKPCTDLPMTWYNRKARTSAPMLPINQIQVKSTSRRNAREKKLRQKRNLKQKIDQIRSSLKSEDIELHFIQTFLCSDNWRKGGTYMTLSDRIIRVAAEHDHTYYAKQGQYIVTVVSSDVQEGCSLISHTVPDTTQPVIYYDVKQRSKEWFELREGLLTSSCCGSLISVKLCIFYDIVGGHGFIQCPGQVAPRLYLQPLLPSKALQVLLELHIPP